MAILQSELKNVVLGMNRVEKDMQMLKLDYGSRARDIQLIHLGNIARHTRELEFHLNIAILVCAMAGGACCQEDNLPAMAGLHWAFGCMNDVFRHLRRIVSLSKEGNPGVTLFETLEADWEEFKQAVFKTIEVTVEPERKKEDSWPGKSSGRRRRVWSGRL